MTDQPLRDSMTEVEASSVPRFVEEAVEDAPAPRPVRATPTARVEARPSERKLSLVATLDKPLIVVVGLLLTVGLFGDDPFGAAAFAG